jgi:hypothetical protein
MKTIFRILVILAVAALLSGGMYLFVQNLPGSANFSAERGNRPQFVQPPANGQAPQPNFRPDGDFGRQRNASLGRGLVQIVGTLIKLAVIVLLLLLAQRVLGEALKRPARSETTNPL